MSIETFGWLDERFLLSSSDTPRRPRVPKTVRPQPAPTPKTTMGNAAKRVLRNAVVASRVHIDKVIASLTYSDVNHAEVELARERANALLRPGADGQPALLQRGTTKGEGFRNVYICRLPSKAAAIVKIGATGDNAKQAFQLTINPANMRQPDDYRACVELLRAVLGPEANSLRKRFKLVRVDLCVDVAGAEINNLLVKFAGARSQSLIFMLTDSGGKAQTYYLGSLSSQRHAIVYDQEASDLAKAAYGEKVSARPKMEEDAEIVMKKREGRTRFEVRHEFKELLSFGALPKLSAALDEFTIYDLGDIRSADRDIEFLAYLDCVRLRGIAGARKHLATTKELKAAVNQLEQRMARYLAEWASKATSPAKANAAEEIEPVMKLFLPKEEFKAFLAARLASK